MASSNRRIASAKSAALTPGGTLIACSSLPKNSIGWRRWPYDPESMSRLVVSCQIRDDGVQIRVAHFRLPEHRHEQHAVAHKRLDRRPGQVGAFLQHGRLLPPSCQRIGARLSQSGTVARKRDSVIDLVTIFNLVVG